MIAFIFQLYPESVLGTWVSLPLAIGIGLWVYKKGGGLLGPSLAALAVIYACVAVGAYAMPISINAPVDSLNALLGYGADSPFNVVTVWTMVLLTYCFFASVLPVWMMLQPRDYINSHQLVVALGLLMLGVIVAGATGKAQLAESAPMIATQLPADAPPVWPFLFITIACGACSGFHCLVSSGTTSKQINCETDAQYVAYGSMLLEGGLAVMVILACCAGVGMGAFDRVDDVAAAGGYRYQARLNDAGEHIIGNAAWSSQYDVGKKLGGVLPWQ